MLREVDEQQFRKSTEDVGSHLKALCDSQRWTMTQKKSVALLLDMRSVIKIPKSATTVLQ
jgi:hypothetical protein